MRLIKALLSINIISIICLSGVFASPPVSVAGPESLSRTSFCPTPTPLVCVEHTPCPEPSECPVCETPTPETPTPTTPIDACAYYAVDFVNIGVRNRGSVKIDQSNAKDLSCFEDIVNKALDTLPSVGGADWGDYSKDVKFNKSVGRNKHFNGGILSSLIWEQLKNANGLKSSLNFSTTVNDVGQLSADNKKAQKAINCTGGYGGVTLNGQWQFGGSFYGGWAKVEDGCKSGKMYLDKDCKFVDADSIENAKSCGSINYQAEISTPVSLVWNENYDTKASTLVNFKLNPHSDNNTWLWRGSESLPLLVYDPEHTGVISSATQLFGSWTFGGNGLASLIEGNSKGTPWRDGYEALSKMDKDLDGKVSGAELKDIALWFDKNQDGISQEGEVKTLSEVSVTALYYNSDRKEQGALVASKGYDREVNGKTTTSSSMDWYEKGLKDGFDIMLDNLGAANKSSSPRNVDAKSEHAKEVSPEIYGAWGWTLDGPAKGSGVFAFEPTEDGVVGTNISQLVLTGLSEVSSQIMFSHFVTEQTKGEDGASRLKFIVQGPNGAILTNTASLSKDGKELLGKTVVTGSSLSESGTYEYAWKAERVK